MELGARICTKEDWSRIVDCESIGVDWGTAFCKITGLACRIINSDDKTEWKKCPLGKRSAKGNRRNREI